MKLTLIKLRSLGGIIMRETEAEQVNLICDCGYETGFIDVLKLHKVIRRAGGSTTGKANKNQVTMNSSVCPSCKGIDSFDIETSTTVIESGDMKISRIKRL